MVHSARKPPTMVKVQPAAYRNTGTPTTNQTSRAPNSTTRAAASRLMPRFLANSSLADFRRLALAHQRRHEGDHAHQHQRQQRRHGPQRLLEAQHLQQQAAQEEAHALHRVLAAGEEGHPLEQLARGLAGGQLDGRLAGGLGQVLGHAADALREHHPGHRHRPRPVG
jgi:hypothetical protein